MKNFASAVFALLLTACGSLTSGHDQQDVVQNSWNGSDKETDRFITLGTHGGPYPSAARSQPANALLTNGHVYLIDAGDGAAGQLAKADIPLDRLKGVFISHLHFDHTGGLAAILGLRYQTNIREPLTIYGPPGTRELVDGIIDSMAPAAAMGGSLPGSTYLDPTSTVMVIEMSGEETIAVDSMSVSATRNSHYKFEPGSDEDKRFQSLSFRFDTPSRSIVYTGDTGPSESVETLAAGADILVTEMTDVDRVVARMVARQKDTPNPINLEFFRHSISSHHLTPENVGKMAAGADVKTVVVTHFGVYEATPKDLQGYVARIGNVYSGTVIIANDLDEY